MVVSLWIAFKFVSLCRILQLLASSVLYEMSCELLSNLYLCVGFYNVTTLKTIWKLVVNCFQICIFVSDFTTHADGLVHRERLWIAFKFVSLCRILQPSPSFTLTVTVVNCFQICIFVSDFTTRLRTFGSTMKLWIAFKFVSLCRILQPAYIRKRLQYRCELLSNLYLCVGFYNLNLTNNERAAVVNCFQICIFVSDFTTWSRWWQQRSGCELLSNLYLCVGFYNTLQVEDNSQEVVNCFQICIFVSDFTTLWKSFKIPFKLWIAFKFVSLCRILQRAAYPAMARGVVNCFQICIFVSDFTTFTLKWDFHTSCELLSNLYLCVGFYNLSNQDTPKLTVVNCFQICIFVSDFTTGDCRQKQQWRCELLSNLYLCVGFYNFARSCHNTLPVVNCFQICIFVSDFTTVRQRIYHSVLLWIAFKFVSLCRILQRSGICLAHPLRCELLSNLYLCVGFYNCGGSIR